MSRIIKYLLSRSKIVLFISILLFILGVYSYIIIPKQEMPDFSSAYGVFSVTAPGLSASDVEAKIVSPIEDILEKYTDVESIRSTSYESFAVVTVEFPYSVNNPDKIVNEMYLEISEYDYPVKISISVNSNFKQHDVIFALYNDSISEDKLIIYSKLLKNKLLDIKHISYVDIDSHFKKQVIVSLNNEVLNTLPITFLDIYNLIYANGREIPLGVLHSDEQTIQIDVDPSYKSISELENLIIIPETPETNEVLLGSISSISLAQIPNQKVYEYNGEKALYIGVKFSDNIDFTTLGDDLRDVVNDFKIGVEDVNISEMNFQPDYVDDQIKGVFDSLLMCVAVVMIVVMLGLGVRNSLAIIFTIPIIIFTTILLLNLYGLKLEKLSIVGLIVAIGIIVDNSIVISEAIQFYIDKGMTKRDSVINAVKDNSIPVLSSTVTTIAAFIVITMIPGFLGVIIESFPITVIIALSLSYLIAMFVSPIIGYNFFKVSSKKCKKDRKFFKKTVFIATKHPILLSFGSIFLLIGSIFLLFKYQPIELFPKEEKQILYIDYEFMYPGDSDGAYEFAKEIESEILKQDKVKDYGFSQGGDLPKFHLSTPIIKELPQFGRFIIHLDMKMDEMYEYQKYLQNILNRIKKGKVIVRSLELKQPEPPVQVYLTSDNIDELNRVASKVYSEIRTLNSLDVSDIVKPFNSLKSIIEFDRSLLGAHYITFAEAQYQISTQLNGLSANVFDYNDNLINIITSVETKSVHDIMDYRIKSHITGLKVPLYEIAKINLTESTNEIYREDGKRLIKINAYPNEKSDSSKLEKEIKNIVNKYIVDDIKVSYGGDSELFKEISSHIITAAIFALILIYLIMFIQFNSFIKPLIIYATIPLSFIGSFIFLVIFNQPITATSMIGLISLLGIVVNTGILLIENIDKEIEKGKKIREACIDATIRRFKPIILTSATTIFGLVPLALTGGNFFEPMAYSLIGGIIVSTLLTLYVVPSLYHSFLKKKFSN